MPRSIAALLTVALVVWPTIGGAQHIRRTDDITQAALIESGLAAETRCAPTTTLPALPGARKPPPYHLAHSITGVLDGQRDGTASRIWRGWGLAQLRVHGRDTGCHFDWRARVVAGTRARVGVDALARGTLTGVLGGALHLFGEAGAASDGEAVEELGTARHTELGVAYTTFNLLAPFYSLLALDLRARVSVGSAFGYGETAREQDRPAVADFSTSVVLKVEEYLHGGVLYTVRLVPDYVKDTHLAEHTVTVMHGIRSGVPDGLRMRSPYLTARYSRRRVGDLRGNHEVALSAGLTLF
jgi:hypothetical protein